MTQEPRPKGRRDTQAKKSIDADTAASVKKTDSVTFRTRMKADLEKAAAAANRSVSEQIEYMLGRALEWERALGDVEVFKADLASMKAQLEEGKRQTEAAERYRAGWGKMYDPNVPGGVVWFPPGTHNIPQGGFEAPNAQPPAPAPLPPVLREVVRAEVQSAVREILEEAGLLSKKKSGGAAA
jgi:hypothetical protein